MQLVVVLLLVGAHLAFAGTHSLRYFYTGVSGVIDFPEFTAVGLVDDEQFMYFDSNTMKAVPKTEWIRQNEGADYWTRETQTDINHHQTFKNNIQVAKGRFNQTTGVHTVQLMYGCEFDDQTGATNAFHQFGYDGEDFLYLDLKELRWITPVPQGIFTVLKWNNDRAALERDKHYFRTECIEWLKKYVEYGKSSLKKTVSPQVSLLQKSPSSPVTCHATGFYPSGVTVTWMRNGQELHDDVDLSELVPNEDGTFQKTSTITVTPDEWKKNEYSCVVEHQGKTIRKILTEKEIRTNNGTHSLRYFYTGVSGVIDFPEFTAVGLVDDEQFMYFDSNTMKAVPKTEWIRQNEGADYWTRETQTDINHHQTFKNNIQVAKERFNQTSGVHTVQLMYGCEFDDQTGATNAFHQFGYDGEDFLYLDLKELRWITPVPQGIFTVLKWNNDRNVVESHKHYFSTECIEWLKKYVEYGKSSLKKTVSPQVSLLQKSSSCPVTCHATGFYPSGVTVTWMRNGQELHDDVDLSELVPNEDGTFQKTSTITVTPDEWKKNKYSCVVEHQGKTIRKILTEKEIRTNNGTHSLRYFYTGVSGVIDFPEFTAVGLVDDEQFMYFDSNTMKAVPKTEWIRQNEGADYWTRETQIDINHHQTFKNNIQIAKGRFNQTSGVHTVQLMYGCEFDDQTGATNAFHQFGYDGEDFLYLDLKELRWITPVPQGIFTVLKWSYDRGLLESHKHYFSTECIEWLKKYVEYGKSSLKKTVSPQVSLLQKSSSCPVTCHATGFYPSGVTVTWMRNGQELYDDVDLSELLPNEDGTFQRTTTITVTPDEWKKNEYSCVVEHQGKTIRQILTEKEIRTNNGSDDGSESSAHTDPHNENDTRDVVNIIQGMLTSLSSFISNLHINKEKNDKGS